MHLIKDENNNVIQGFPLYYGKVNLTAVDGDIGQVRIIHCVVDGNIIVTFIEGPTDPKTISMTEGQDYTLPAGATVDLTGSTGTFHVV